MDSLITAAARALAAGDPLGALKRVALRDDAPALALRGIAMAQLGDLVRAKDLLRRAARAFGPKEAVARARCVVAEAEIALVSRDLGWPAKALDAARATLEAHAGGAPDCEWRGASPPARGGRSGAGVERIRRGRVPSCRAPRQHGGLARNASGVVRARPRAGRSVAGRCTEGRARGAGIRIEARRRIASRAVARRGRAASHGASDAGPRERDEARFRAGAAPRTRGGRAGPARRRGACVGARLPRRRGIVVELGPRACAWNEPAHRAAGARLARGGWQG